mgnify:CR=1 FL=1
MGNTVLVLGPANTAKYGYIWPPAKHIANAFEAYNPCFKYSQIHMLCVMYLALALGICIWIWHLASGRAVKQGFQLLRVKM